MKSLKNTFWLVSKIHTMLYITILLAKNVFYYDLFAALVTHSLVGMEKLGKSFLTSNSEVQQVNGPFLKIKEPNSSLLSFLLYIPKYYDPQGQLLCKEY
jgi:hypothetical protein